VEQAEGSGNGARKRSRANYEEEEEEKEEEEEQQQQHGEDDDEEKEEVEHSPSPPAKRAKFEFPCVVPSCDRGYKSKASLQRHVFKSHDRVSDPVARKACRLLWGETFKGRLATINQRYGRYPKGV
jgi:ABC-type Zn2+ transport system substrate-binding protein/surface adhesin